jgi:Ca2+-binding EF-hand superfamily protein
VQKRALDQLFDAADTDHDGKVSFDEFINLFTRRSSGSSRGASTSKWPK